MIIDLYFTNDFFVYWIVQTLYNFNDIINMTKKYAQIMFWITTEAFIRKNAIVAFLYKKNSKAENNYDSYIKKVCKWLKLCGVFQILAFETYGQKTRKIVRLI